jgi:hypothetical protein
LRIIACFPRSSLAHLTGFKFKYQYSSSDDPKLRISAGSTTTTAAVSTVMAPVQTSQSLYLLAARLIKHKLITIEDLYPHLLPEDSLAAEEYAKRFEKAAAPVPGILGVAPSSSSSGPSAVRSSLDFQFLFLLRFIVI